MIDAGMKYPVGESVGLSTKNGAETIPTVCNSPFILTTSRNYY